MHERSIMKERQNRRMRQHQGRAALWEEVSRLFEFREVPDAEGNTHVLWAHLPFDEDRPISVRRGEYVLFEGLQNHEHLMDDLTEAQFYALIPAMESLCRALTDVLSVRYPERIFHTGALIQKGGTLLIRFWQEWQGEENYWPDDLQTDESREILIHYKTGGQGQ